MAHHLAPSVPSSSRLHTVRRSPLVVALVVGATVLAAVGTLGDPASGSTYTVQSRNLVKDPNFNHGTSAWTVTRGARLSIVKGRSGHRAIRVRNETRHSLTVALNDRANTVAATTAATTYVASAWIRTTRPRLTAAVREGEWKGRKAQAPARLRSAWMTDTRWHFVRVTYRAVANRSSIDLNLIAWKLPRNSAFDVSQPQLVSITTRQLSGGAPVKPVPPAPSVPISSPPASPSSSAAPTPPAPPTSTTPSPDPVSTPPAKPTPTTAAPVPPSSTPPSSTPPSSTPPPAQDSRLVFEDNFNGNQVDASKWHVRNNSWASNEQSIMTSRASNVSVSGGVLTLRAQRERYTAYSTTRDYTSGYLDTIGLQSQQYGRWVMRAKLPSAKGLWPAFWLRSDHSEGEIDILEAIGGMSRMTVQTAFPSTNDGKVKKSNIHNLPDTAGIDAWHVYGLSWTPNSISWDIDGLTVYKITSADAAWVSTAFRDTMNIRLNLQVGGSMPAYFNQPVDTNSALPGEYQVDYVRVYAP